MTKTNYPHLHNEGQTHWPGCYREKGHHNCAIDRIEQLENKVKIQDSHLQDLIEADIREQMESFELPPTGENDR